jgi:hypothetical protein
VISLLRPEPLTLWCLGACVVSVDAAFEVRFFYVDGCVYECHGPARYSSPTKYSSGGQCSTTTVSHIGLGVPSPYIRRGYVIIRVRKKRIDLVSYLCL